MPPSREYRRQEISKLLYAAAVMRHVPGILKWISDGCSGPPPPIVKRMILEAYLKNFNLSNFIETGTFRGDTIAWIARDPKTQCTTIELSEEFYRRAKERFRDSPNVKVLHGDSGMVLPQLVGDLTGPTLFWLDGDYSGQGTAQADIDTPITAELLSIFKHPVKAHVILIDDAHLFTGTNGYPSLDALIHFVKGKSGYQLEISANIIRLTPPAPEQRA